VSKKKVEKKSAEVEMKTYIMDLFDGRQRRLTVPANWKVTFGPLIRASNDMKRGGVGGTLALRFYESESKQRAIFTDVACFRDASLVVEEKVTKTKKQTLYKDSRGKKKAMQVEGRITQWVDPDEPMEEDAEDYALLPAFDEGV
jgi:hypothetical protein